MKRSFTGGAIFDVANHAFMVLFVILLAYPFLYVFSYSFSDPSRLTGGLLLWPQGFSLDAYSYSFQDRSILRGIMISVLRATIGPLTMIIVTSMAAYCLTRDDFLFVRTFRKFFVFTMYFSAGLIPSYILAKTLHLTGTFWIYILPLTIAVFNMILLKAYMENLPKELEESALMDGANDFYLFWRIIFPLCTPVIAAVVLFSAVQQWNAFIDTEIYNSMNPDLFTLQYMLYQTLTGANINVESLVYDRAVTVTPQSIKMAVTMITILPIACIYPLLQRYFIKGLLVGSIKG